VLTSRIEVETAWMIKPPEATHIRYRVVKPWNFRREDTSVTWLVVTRPTDLPPLACSPMLRTDLPSASMPIAPL
jgi:hypothetical protein